MKRTLYKLRLFMVTALLLLCGVASASTKVGWSVAVPERYEGCKCYLFVVAEKVDSINTRSVVENLFYQMNAEEIAYYTIDSKLVNSEGSCRLALSKSTVELFSDRNEYSAFFVLLDSSDIGVGVRFYISPEITKSKTALGVNFAFGEYNDGQLIGNLHRVGSPAPVMPPPYAYDLKNVDYPVEDPEKTFYVSPSGNDSNTGKSWKTALRTIQAAVDKASSNSVINVSAVEDGNICVYAPVVTHNKAILIQSFDKYGRGRKPEIVGGLGQSCVEGMKWEMSEEREKGQQDDYYWHDFSRLTILKGFTLRGGEYGVYGCTVINCELIRNSSFGAYASRMINCLVADNYGRGAGYSTLVNCTIARNFGNYDAALRTDCYAYNCIIWQNTNSLGQVSVISENYPPVVTPNWMKLYGCCTDMVPEARTDTIYCSYPNFVNPSKGDYHLRPESPCIGKGYECYSVASETTDLDGENRRENQIEPGCYEYGVRPVKLYDPDGYVVSDADVLRWWNSFGYTQAQVNGTSMKAFIDAFIMNADFRANPVYDVQITKFERQGNLLYLYVVTKVYERGSLVNNRYPNFGPCLYMAKDLHSDFEEPLESSPPIWWPKPYSILIGSEEYPYVFIVDLNATDYRFFKVLYERRTQQ